MGATTAAPTPTRFGIGDTNRERVDSEYENSLALVPTVEYKGMDTYMLQMPSTVEKKNSSDAPLCRPFAKFHFSCDYMVL